MTVTMFLRRRLLSQLLGIRFGGWLKILFDLKGDLAVAEKVLPASAYEVLKAYLQGNANLAELVKATSGADQISVAIEGYAVKNNTIIVEGDIEHILAVLGQLSVAEQTQHGASAFVTYMTTRSQLASNRANGVGGEVEVNPNADGLVVIAYKYTTEENDAGGTTYHIISDYRYDSGGTVYIGGQDGS